MTTAPVLLQSTCPAWCVNAARGCDGDHWSDPGSPDWPEVRAPGYSGDGAPVFYPHPAWTEMDGLAPSVALWICRERSRSVPARREIDETIDFTPAEARDLAARLIAAANAAEGMGIIA